MLTEPGRPGLRSHSTFIFYTNTVHTDESVQLHSSKTSITFTNLYVCRLRGVTLSPTHLSSACMYTHTHTHTHTHTPEAQPRDDDTLITHTFKRTVVIKGGTWSATILTSGYFGDKLLSCNHISSPSTFYY